MSTQKRFSIDVPTSRGPVTLTLPGHLYLMCKSLVDRPGEFVSFDTLCKEMSTTKGAVKVAKGKLQEYLQPHGLSVFTSRTVGYRIAEVGQTTCR